MKENSESAYRHCIRIAEAHYENFPVLSWTLPRRLRPHVAAIYAFARAADDDADEIQGRAGADRLNRARRRIETADFEGDPVFEALGHTIREFDLPPKPFLDLIDAFVQDTCRNRYESYDEVLDYCSRSANPVGHLVLMLFGYQDAERFALSDRICTALQLINFWQDVRPDYAERNRIYIPQADLRQFGVEERDLLQAGGPQAGPALRGLIDFQVRRTLPLMKEGWKLVRLLPWRYKFPIALFAAGGTTILRRIRANAPRPTLGDAGCRFRLPYEFLKVMTSERTGA